MQKRLVLIIITFIGFTLKAQIPNVYLNEAMAINTATLQDEFSEYPDWFELYNASTSELNLDGFTITDNAPGQVPWVFPSVTIPANGYLMLFASGRDIKTPPVVWDTPIDWGDSLKYLIPDANTPTNWYSVPYNDANWQKGVSGFGFGDNDDATFLPTGTLSVYLRVEFEIEQLQAVQQAILHMDYDDAFVAYLNGVEIARSNIGTAGVPVGFNQLATTDSHEALIYRNMAPETYNIPNFRNILVEGKNVLAIQVHNASAGSSDFTAIPFFSIGYSSVNKPVHPSSHLNLKNTALHTSFRLEKDGETLTLRNKNGDLVDSLTFPSLAPNLTFGREFQNPNKKGFLATPTPGFANSKVVNNAVDKITFSLQCGFYNGSQTLQLTTSDVTDSIFYTTDGSAPTTQSILYKTPITLTKTTVIRALAYSSNKLPGTTSTYTYFIDEEVHLPVISLSTNAEHFFSDETGIYVTGTNGIPGQCDQTPRNLNQDWERPINIEFYDTDGSLKINQMAGVKIFGGCSRTRFPQKSLAIFARSDYGNGTFDYQFFDEKPITKFESFLLRSSADDQVSTMFRDALAQSVLVEYMDVDYQAYQPAVVFFNGEYWGIHNIREKFNEPYLESNFNVDGDTVNILEKDGAVVTGINSTYKAMMAFAEKNSLADMANYRYMETQMDINQYIDYMVANIYLAERDWPGNNIKFWSAAEGAYTRWRWLLYDRDQTFTHTTTDAMAMAAQVNCNCGWPNPPWSTLLFRKLLQNAEFKNKFIQMFAYQMETTFDPERLIDFIDEFEARIAPEIPRHITKWGGKKVEDSSESWQTPTFNSVEQWQSNVQEMRLFSEERPEYASQHILNYFKLSGMAPLSINVENQNGGFVKLYHKSLPVQGYSAKHFKSIPVELTAIANKGYKFEHWLVTSTSGTTQRSEKTITINPGDVATVTAVFGIGETIEGPIITINEINYNSSPEFNTGDWVELYNQHTDNIDLEGWKIKDSEDNNFFQFPIGSSISGNGYLVICQSTTDFEVLFPQVKNRTGNLGFKLSNSGEVIRLFDRNGLLVDSVHFADSAPWPSKPDGEGYSLELLRKNLNNDVPENWVSSLIIGGTPGWVNGTEEWISISDAHPKMDENLIFNAYPNPMHHSTNLHFELERPSNVEIKLVNIAGSEVLQILNGTYENGVYNTVFEKGSLQSGIYFLSLTLDSSLTKTLKIVVL